MIRIFTIIILLFTVPIVKAAELTIEFETSRLRDTLVSKDQSIIPPSVAKWLNQELDAAKVKTLKNDSDDEFFQRDTIKIVGYIKGYDANAGFTSGIIHNENNLTFESLPSTIRIYEDGRFETTFLALHAVYSKILINGKWISFYAEPGNTIGIILDWRDYLATKQNDNNRPGIGKTEYLGITKKVNEELSTFKINEPEFSRINDFLKNMTPNEFKTMQLNQWEKEKQRVENLFTSQPLSPLSQSILKDEIEVNYSSFILAYAIARFVNSMQDTSNVTLKIPIEIDFYDFVDKMDLNKMSLLRTNRFSLFINTFESSPLFPSSKFLSNINQERAIYPNRVIEKDQFTMLDSFCYEYFKTDQIPLLFTIAKLRKLNFAIGNSKNDTTLQKLYLSATKEMNNPFLREEVDRLMAQHNKNIPGYELPDTKAAAVFKKIIEPYKGKVLIIDFWAEWCGPCRLGIENSKELRRKYNNKQDFDFIFITDESGSPNLEFFNDYSEKNNMTNSYRVTADEYRVLRELFKFNGIPRYVLVDEKGWIRNDNFQSHNLKTELPRYFPEKFAADYFND